MSQRENSASTAGAAAYALCWSNLEGFVGWLGWLGWLVGDFFCVFFWCFSVLQVLTTLNQASDWHEAKLYLIKMRYSYGSFHLLTVCSVDSFISLHSEFSDCSLPLTGALLPNVPCVSASVIMVSLQASEEQGPWHQVLALQREIETVHAASPPVLAGASRNSFWNLARPRESINGQIPLHR